MIMKFKDHPHAQAQIIINEDGSMELQSYETIVAKVSRDGWLRIITIHNPKLYFDNAELNVSTGEVLVHMML